MRRYFEAFVDEENRVALLVGVNLMAACLGIAASFADMPLSAGMAAVVVEVLTAPIWLPIARKASARASRELIGALQMDVGAAVLRPVWRLLAKATRVGHH